ncbi:MAG: hypothetical protein AB7F88_12730 [Pyrinomonadaceae bacterium]
MFGIKVSITRCIDDTGPSFVECEFRDASGFVDVFRDKDAIFSIENLDRNSEYPVDGVLGCEVLNKPTMQNPLTTRVDTKKPWGIESLNGKTIFEVNSELIVEFSHPADSNQTNITNDEHQNL